jgi:hypothetical protein
MHPDKDFLRDYVKDARAEMNWRREVEFRLMQFLLVFYPILGTAIVTLYQTQIVSSGFWVLAIGAIVFILTASIFVSDRVQSEHRAYAGIGRTIQKIWTYFGLFERGAYLADETILPEQLRDPEKGFGQGQGYKKTLLLIWLVTVAMVLMILALAFLKSP